MEANDRLLVRRIVQDARLLSIAVVSQDVLDEANRHLAEPVADVASQESTVRVAPTEQFGEVRETGGPMSPTREGESFRIEQR